MSTSGEAFAQQLGFSVAAAAEAGAEVAHPPTEIPGHGSFAILIHGGVEHGLWQKQGSRQG